MPTSGSPQPRDERWTTALAGMVALAVAMGIGRFAFTPILPMMLHDGLLDLPTGSWLASANYAGYLVGALACALQPWGAARLRARRHRPAVRSIHHDWCVPASPPRSC